MIADSAIPIGLHAQSFGLERALQDHRGTELPELIASLLRSPDVRVDAGAVALAYRRDDLVELDVEVTAHRTSTEYGRASRRSGRRLAELAAHICDTGFCRQVRERVADGNLTVVQASMTEQLGLPVEASVLVAVNRTAAALVLAAVRLGQAGTAEGQRILTGLEPVIIDIVDKALRAGLGSFGDDLPLGRSARPSVVGVSQPILFQT